MLHYWPMVVFGWPAVILGAGLLIFGVARSRARLSLAGAVLVSGFSAYMAMMPGMVRWLGVAALVGAWASVAAVRNRLTWPAALALVPLHLLLLAVAYSLYAHQA